jgi:3-oxoacyl-[acyl-carrier protein] reductase
MARFALGRYGAPEEIAPAFVYLASAESDYVTGQILCVDGGLVI